jgi:pimeloyl-ACP methyl ester carboxylesterase
VIAPDLRGHGLTEKPESGYDFAAIDEDVVGLVRALRLHRPLLVGHSWGAAVALDYAVRHPDGPEAASGIALIDGGMTQFDDMPEATWERISQLLAPPRLIGLRKEDFVARLSDPTRPWRPAAAAMESILGNFELRPDGTIAPWLTFDRHMRLLRSMWEFRTYDHFAEVRCPVLMVPVEPPEPRGVEEEGHLLLKRKGIARARQVISGLHVEWMHDTVHDVPLQRPEALAAVLTEFGDSLPADP